MACLSEESWVSLPQMLSKRASLLECPEEDDKPNFMESKSNGRRLDKVFPVYALGISKPDPKSLVSLANSSDPIWEAVRKEAKLEVGSWLRINSIISF